MLRPLFRTGDGIGRTNATSGVAVMASTHVPRMSRWVERSPRAISDLNVGALHPRVGAVAAQRSRVFTIIGWPSAADLAGNFRRLGAAI